MSESRQEQIPKLASLLRKASYPVAFTGAGISTESGIPDYRSPSTGLWTKMDPEKISVRAFRHDPMKFYRDYQEFVSTLTDCQPNQGHLALAELSEMGLCNAVMTQNIDGLHQLAGSPRVLEVHGHIRTCRCNQCGKDYPHEDMMNPVAKGELPKSSCCDALLRTNVVLFGDAMASDFDTALYEARRADFCLVLGSSLSVYPAATLPSYSGSFGIINRDSTGQEGNALISIQGELGEIMQELILELKRA